jgi:ribose-phosphate pyrophosphokinase
MNKFSNQLDLASKYNKMIDSVSKILEILNLDLQLEVDATFSGFTYRQYIFKKFKKVRIICGPSNERLASDILKELGIDGVKCELGFFADKSPRVEITENIREVHMFIIQSGSNSKNYSINDYSEQLLAIIDACKRSGTKSITAIIPYFPNARSDKRDTPRVPIMAKATIQKFENAGVDRTIMLDLHSGQIQGFGNKPIDNLYAKPLFISFLKNTFFRDMTTEEINSANIFISPDTGGYKRVHAYSETMKINNVTMHKDRDYTVPNQILKSVIVGKGSNISGKRCFVFDDMIDTAGTLISGTSELIAAGAVEVVPIATHGVFSGPAIKRINECDHIKNIVVTNTLPQEQNIKECIKKIHVINIAPILAYTIVCLRFGGSISKLFNMDQIKYSADQQDLGSIVFNRIELRT